MKLSFLSPSRCVLLVGDEALYVYNVNYKVSQLLGSAAWSEDNFDETIIGMIRKGTGSKSILIINDMTDQHFKGGQRMPKVGVMDRANILARKLQVAFPTYPIRGALPIKNPGKLQGPAVVDGVQQSGELYLFAAVPMSEPIGKTMDVVKASLASISGLCLLPVEASDMVKALAAKLTGKERAPSRWVIFVGQHHSGSLRQVIIRDGQLAMTRMTPMNDTGADRSAWAQEVFLEFKATISYLSRFGFTPEDGTDVIVVCHPESGRALEALIDIPCHYSTFTSPEAARELGINIGAQENPEYADPLHAAWIGRKTRLILPMQAEELKKIHQPRQMAAVAMFMLILGIGYLGWQLTVQAEQISDTKENINSEQRQLDNAMKDYDAEVKKMNGLGFDVKLIQGASETYADLESHRIHELLLIKKINAALGDHLRLDALTVGSIDSGSSSATPPPAAAPNASSSKPQLKASLKLSFPATVLPAAGVSEINNFKRRLEVALPNCTVTIDKNVAGLEYSDTFTGEVGATPNKTDNQKSAAELTIKGSAE